ncbi:hypothetical protein [Dyella silvatica]|uniref:hypothetical protein n=1 Tax=Dyella silvatica TaxID=2992128 RepID=UPI00224E4771|nr:hypothetical protein [Dyella silvatica]
MTTPTTTHNDQPPLSPRLTAKQALQRLLELIRGSQSISDFTPEYMHKGMDVDIKVINKNEYGYGERLSPSWAWSIQHLQVGSIGPRVDFVFGSMPGTQPSPAEICEFDFADFTAELEAMGFSRQSSHGEHNRWTFDYFDRPGMRVEVHPMAMPADSNDAGQACVKMVLVR